jgi:hypothetical protein
MPAQPSPAGRCSNHIDNAAVFECVPCRRYLCNVCVKIVKLPNATVEQCPRCGSLAQRLGALGQSRVADVVRQSQGQGPLISRLADTPAFLIKPTLLFVLLGLAVFQTIVSGGGLAGSMMSLGVQAWVYFSIVEQTAHGREDFEAPEFDHLVDSVFMPMFRYLVALLPIIIGVISFALEVFKDLRVGVGTFEAKPTIVLDHIRPMAIILAGLVAWPLLTVIAAISKSIPDMLSPKVWVATLREMGSDYIVGAIAFYILLAVELFVWQPLVWRAALSVHVPFVTSVGVLFLGHLPMALRARILGTMAAPYV